MNKSSQTQRRALGFALLGCGRIARKHAELLGGGHIERAQLVAVCDISPERSIRLAEEYGVESFVSKEEMIESLASEIDVVNILTPSGLHAQHCVELAGYGKHLIVEKPMALRVQDADDMIQACDSAGIRLFIVKQNRYNLPVQKLKEALNAGRFGKLVLGTVRVRWSRDQSYYDQDEWRGSWALDGGVFANQASHHVDLLEWFMGEPESVVARGITALVSIEAEDTGVAIVRFRNGALGVIEATTATRPVDLEGSISVLGEGGSAEIGGFAVNQMRVWSFDQHSPEDDEVLANYRENPPNVYGFGHRAFLDEVVGAVLDGAPFPIDGREGRKSLRLISAIYEALETGREVRIESSRGHSRLGVRT